MSDPYEDNPFEPTEPPEVYVKCLLCGETMSVDEFESFHQLECDMIGYERI